MSDLTFFARLIFGMAITSGMSTLNFGSPGRARDMAGCVATLGLLSRELLFIDPHFCPEPRFEKVFLECLHQTSAKEGRFRRIEVHISGTKRCAFGDSCVLNRFSSRFRHPA